MSGAAPAWTGVGSAAVGLLPVLAVRPVVEGPTLAHVAPGGARAAHAGRHVLTGVQVADIHTLPSKVPCGDKPALPPPQSRPLARQARLLEPNALRKASRPCALPRCDVPDHSV